MTNLSRSSVWSRRFFLLASVASLTVTSGCGGGLGSLAAALGGSSSSGSTVTRIATAALVNTPDDGQTGRTPIRIDLQFDPMEAVRLVSVEYSLFGDGEGMFRAVTPAQGFPTEILPGELIPPKSTTGEIQTYRLDWNSHFDLDNRRREIDSDLQRPVTARAVLRVTILNESTGEPFTRTTDEFFLDHSLVKTVAGGGVGDGDDPSFASMLDPIGVTVDEVGNLLIADSGNNRIRKITLDVDNPTLPTLMETRVGNGFRGVFSGLHPAFQTGMNGPRGTAVTIDGNFYVAEFDPDVEDPDRRGVIRFVDRSTNLISTAIASLVSFPVDLELDGETSLFVSDEDLAGIREFNIENVDPVSGSISEFVDHTGAIFDDDLDGTPDTALVIPAGIALFPGDGVRFLAIADRGANKVFVLDLDTGMGVRRAGGGVIDPTDTDNAVGAFATDLALQGPRGVSFDDQFLYIADRDGDVIVVVALLDGRVANVVEGLTRPSAVEAFKGFLFVCEASDGSVAAAKTGHRVTVVADPGIPGVARIINLVAHQSEIQVTQGLDGVSTQMNCYDPDQSGDCGDGDPPDLGTENNADPVGCDRGLATTVKAAALESPLARPEDVLLDLAGQLFFVADTGNGLVCSISEATGLMTVVAGSLSDDAQLPSAEDQGALSVSLDRPVGLAFDELGGELFIANAYEGVGTPGDRGPGGNVVVLQLHDRNDPTDDEVRLLVPNVTADADALLEQPRAVAYHRFADGSRTLFVADQGRLDAVTGAGEKPRPGLLRVDLDGIGGDIMPGGIEWLDFGTEDLVFDCNDPDGIERSAPFVLRFIRDIHALSHPDGSLDLLVAVDLVDSFLEAGSASVDRAGFEADCYDGVGLDGGGADCIRPMRVVVLRFPFDSTGNLGTVETVIYGFKRFVLDDVRTRCSCGNPAFPSPIDIQDLVIDGFTVSEDGQFLYAVDPCRGDVTFVEFGVDFQIVGFGRAAGVDSEFARSFDGSSPVETAFSRPRAVAIDDLQNLYIVDTLQNRVRRSWIGGQLF